MVALAVSPWTSDDLCYIFLKIWFSLHTRWRLWNKMVQWSSDYLKSCFLLKVNFVATTVDTSAFFSLEFVCCLFFLPVLHLREARLMSLDVHFLISLVAYQRADLAGLSSKEEQTDTSLWAPAAPSQQDASLSSKLPLWQNCPNVWRLDSYYLF